MAFQTHFHIGRGTAGWHTENISKQTTAFTVTLRSLCRNVIENKCIRDLRRLAVPCRCLSEPHKLGIWDGNLLRITILMKFPIPLFFFLAEFKIPWKWLMLQEFCVVLASTRQKGGPAKENRTTVAACFHAFEKVWVWLKPRKSIWGFYFVPTPSNTIHLNHGTLCIRRKQTINHH